MKTAQPTDLITLISNVNLDEARRASTRQEPMGENEIFAGYLPDNLIRFDFLAGQKAEELRKKIGELEILEDEHSRWHRGQVRDKSQAAHDAIEKKAEALKSALISLGKEVYQLRELFWAMAFLAFPESPDGKNRSLGLREDHQVVWCEEEKEETSSNPLEAILRSGGLDFEKILARAGGGIMMAELSLERQR